MGRHKKERIRLKEKKDTGKDNAGIVKTTIKEMEQKRMK